MYVCVSPCDYEHVFSAWVCADDAFVNMINLDLDIALVRLYSLVGKLSKCLIYSIADQT